MESFTPRPPNPFQAWTGKLVPWAPFQMVFAGLLTGPLGASCLAALNWELLGRHSSGATPYAGSRSPGWSSSGCWS